MLLWKCRFPMLILAHWWSSVANCCKGAWMIFILTFSPWQTLESGPLADTQHQFNVRESDWGFTSFMPLQDLYDPAKGFLVNDSLIVEADVNVRKVVDYWAYDSKKETGFVGLKNQGATCYMNSLLQTLYHLPYFRKVFFVLLWFLVIRNVVAISWKFLLRNYLWTRLGTR